MFLLSSSAPALCCEGANAVGTGDLPCTDSKEKRTGWTHFPWDLFDLPSFSQPHPYSQLLLELHQHHSPARKGWAGARHRAHGLGCCFGMSIPRCLCLYGHPKSFPALLYPQAVTWQSVAEQCLTPTASQPSPWKCCLHPLPVEKAAGMGRSELERAFKGRRSETLLSLCATISVLHLSLTQTLEEQVGKVNPEELQSLQRSCSSCQH